MEGICNPCRPIEGALEDLRAGRPVVVVDDEDREDEGDLVLAVQFATPEAINFMAKEGRGLICVALTSERCDVLGLNPMPTRNAGPSRTAFMVSVDYYRKGATTGVSARDRARTVRAVANPETRPEDLVSPGHVFPLKACAGGVFERAGHTEAAVDLACLAGLIPAGVICEIMKDDGTMARVPNLEEFCERHGIKMVTVADLIAYRQREESRAVEREAGQVNVRKRVRTERERIAVPKRREEVSVDRVSVDREPSESEIGEHEVSVPVVEEEVVVDKKPVVKEEVRVRKDVVQDEEVVEEDVRKEEVDVDDAYGTSGRRTDRDV